ncbi:PDZ domain-containing protein [Vibrio cortegadensis]|uniref:PDZ domain-containing protein n=1 Tax=Vibrio cortegadensis TaxID=1328770 RepID=A0ABV4MBX6_9VIBR
MKILSVLFTTLLLSGCATSGYKQFYYPNQNLNDTSKITYLKKGDKVTVFTTDDFDRDIKILLSKKHVLLGYSSFNGGYEDISNAKAQAKQVGATAVLVGAEYTNTQTNTQTLLLPSTQTTYLSGSINGTATTYGTKPVTYTSNQRRFDQTAYYFAKFTQKLQFGVSHSDLTPDMRKELQRNTGAIIEIVYEDTPAFYANIFMGDIVISVDSVNVKNGEHFAKLMAEVPANQPSSEFEILRNGKVHTITVTFE